MSDEGDSTNRQDPRTEPEHPQFWVYMLRCKDNSFYTGYTSDIDRRIVQHNAGIGSRYTRGRRPVQLAWFEILDTKREAMRKELAVKKLSRSKKLELARGWSHTQSVAVQRQ